MTMSAPMARASDVGTGLTMPPSTSSRPSVRITGVNRPGSAMEARTASAMEPSRSQTSAPECRSVATAPKGNGEASMSKSAKLRRQNARSFSPLSMPPDRLTSMKPNTSRMPRPCTQSENRSSSPAA